MSLGGSSIGEILLGLGGLLLLGSSGPRGSITTAGSHVAGYRDWIAATTQGNRGDGPKECRLRPGKTRSAVGDALHNELAPTERQRQRERHSHMTGRRKSRSPAILTAVQGPPLGKGSTLQGHDANRSALCPSGRHKAPFLFTCVHNCR